MDKKKWTKPIIVELKKEQIAAYISAAARSGGDPGSCGSTRFCR